MTSKVDTPDEIMKAVELRSLWVSFKQDHFEEVCIDFTPGKI